MTPLCVQVLEPVSIVTIFSEVIEMALVVDRLAIPAAIMELEATEMLPLPKEVLFPATTVPPLSVVPPA